VQSRRERGLGVFPVWWLHPSRRAQERAPQDEVLDPHGEERGNVARLEPRGHGIRPDDSTQAECALGGDDVLSEHARASAPADSKFQTARTHGVLRTSLRANGSRECAPDDRLREAIHRADTTVLDCFVALLLAMTLGYGPAISPRVFARVLPVNLLPSETEGAGNAGRSMRPQPRMQNKMSIRA
jgi:hypothetical protein